MLLRMALGEGKKDSSTLYPVFSEAMLGVPRP